MNYEECKKLKEAYYKGERCYIVRASPFKNQFEIEIPDGIRVERKIVTSYELENHSTKESEGNKT